MYDDDFGWTKFDDLREQMRGGYSYRRPAAPATPPPVPLANRVAAIGDQAITAVADEPGIFLVRGTAPDPYRVDLNHGTCTCPAYAGRPEKPCKHLIAVQARADGTDPAAMAAKSEAMHRDIAATLDPLRAAENRKRGNVYLADGVVPWGLAYLEGARLPADIEALPVHHGCIHKDRGAVARVVDLRNAVAHGRINGQKTKAVVEAALTATAGYDQDAEVVRIRACYGDAVLAYAATAGDAGLRLLALLGRAEAADGQPVSSMPVDPRNDPRRIRIEVAP